jgi:hypothetical protein
VENPICNKRQSVTVIGGKLPEFFKVGLIVFLSLTGALFVRA